MAFISTFGHHYRKRLWILQSRNTRMGQQFFINYGFKNAGSLCQEVTEAIVWKDRVDTDISTAKELVIIPVRHRSMRRLRVIISEKQGSISISRSETTASGSVFHLLTLLASHDELENAQFVAFDTELYSLLVDEAESGTQRALQPIVTPDSLSVVLRTFDKIKFDFFTDQDTCEADASDSSPWGSLVLLLAKMRLRQMHKNHRRSRWSAISSPLPSNILSYLAKELTRHRVCQSISVAIDHCRSILRDRISLSLETKFLDDRVIYSLSVFEWWTIKVVYINDKETLSLESNQLTWTVSVAKLPDFILKEIGNICTRFAVQELKQILEITQESTIRDPFTFIGHIKDADGSDFVLRVRHESEIADPAIVIEADTFEFSRHISVRHGARTKFEDDAIECTIALLQAIS